MDWALDILSLYHLRKQVSYLLFCVSFGHVDLIRLDTRSTHSLTSLHSGAIEAAIETCELRGELLESSALLPMFDSNLCLKSKEP